MIRRSPGKTDNALRPLGATLKVHELIKLLQDWPDQDATVVLTEGMRLDRWLLVTGVVGRRIALDADNPDFAVPGSEAGIEIV